MRQDSNNSQKWEEETRANKMSKIDGLWRERRYQSEDLRREDGAGRIERRSSNNSRGVKAARGFQLTD